MVPSAFIQVAEDLSDTEHALALLALMDLGSPNLMTPLQVAENLSDVDRALALLAGSHPAQLRAVIGGLPSLARQHGSGACAAVLAPLAAKLAGMEGDAQARAAPGSGWPGDKEGYVHVSSAAVCSIAMRMAILDHGGQGSCPGIVVCSTCACRSPLKASRGPLKWVLAPSLAVITRCHPSACMPAAAAHVVISPVKRSVVGPGSAGRRACSNCGREASERRRCGECAAAACAGCRHDEPA